MKVQLDNTLLFFRKERRPKVLNFWRPFPQVHARVFEELIVTSKYFMAEAGSLSSFVDGYGGVRFKDADGILQFGVKLL